MQPTHPGRPNLLRAGAEPSTDRAHVAAQPSQLCRVTCGAAARQVAPACRRSGRGVMQLGVLFTSVKSSIRRMLGELPVTSAFAWERPTVDARAPADPPALGRQPMERLHRGGR
eukprot:364779-Chlamydomonas_euryale.AAC.11